MSPGKLCRTHFGNIFTKKLIKQSMQKTMSKKNMKIIAKGFQNGTEIDAKTHQKSMPELVSKKIIIKNHVSLKSEIIEIHWKKHCFWWFRRLHVRTVKGTKKTSKMWPNSIRNSMKNRYKKHARKKRAKIWKLIKKVIQKWSNIRHRFGRTIRSTVQEPTILVEPTVLPPPFW